MLVPIVINTADILDQFYISRTDLENMYDNIAKGLALSFYYKWEQEVSNTLKSTKMQYLQNMRLVDSGRMEGTVMLDYSKNFLIQKLEEGAAAFDMKPGLMASPKAKVGKGGKRYITIPMRWATPGAVGESELFSSQMPKEIYKVAKGLGGGRDIPGGGRESGPLKRSSIPEQYQSLGPRPAINDESGKKLFESYTHKNSIYEGIVKKTDGVTAQSMYMSFRRVSENSDSNAFIHPGFKQGDFMQKAYANFDLQGELQQQIDGELSKLGF